MALAEIPTDKSLPVSLAKTALEGKCLKCGVRITYTRRVILGILEQAKGHLTVEGVYRRALTTHADISISTIYSNIRGLVQAGVIERRQFQSKQSYYSANHSEAHDQLIDVESGQVIEFRNEALDKLKGDIAREYGFDMTKCRVEFYARASKKHFVNKQA